MDDTDDDIQTLTPWGSEKTSIDNGKNCLSGFEEWKRQRWLPLDTEMTVKFTENNAKRK